MSIVIQLGPLDKTVDAEHVPSLFDKGTMNMPSTVSIVSKTWVKVS